MVVFREAASQMANVIFTTGLVEAARRSLRNGQTAFDALVVVGGYHFEMGKRQFPAWCEAVMTEVPGGLKQVDKERILSEAYVRMRDRAYELARVAANRGISQATLSVPLNAFMRIDRSHTHPIQAEASAARPETVVAATPSQRIQSPIAGLLEELDAFIGLDGVKRDIAELINSLRVDQMRQKEGLTVAIRSQHMIFYGNPGTGKTTIARLVARVYAALGFLSKGHLVATDRAGLVGEYIGQTAPKVKAAVETAVGGVLFIDEAYSLAPPDSQRDYGQEAVQQLVLLMEQHRNDLVVIAAGYKDDMVRFLDSNPGLKSRFTKKFLFEDYTPEQMVNIFGKLCVEHEYTLDTRAEAKLLNQFRVAYSRRDKTFGNARFVRNCFEKAISNLANRVVNTTSRNRNVLMNITESDISIPMQEPGERNGFFPDLGTYLASKGQPQKTMCIFSALEITRIHVIGRGRYCITQNGILEDGREYCGTFDFGDEVLSEILSRLSTQVRSAIKAELDKNPDGIRAIPLTESVNVGVAASLGRPQVGLHENFIPLIIAELFG